MELAFPWDRRRRMWLEIAPHPHSKKLIKSLRFSEIRTIKPIKPLLPLEGSPLTSLEKILRNIESKAGDPQQQLSWCKYQIHFPAEQHDVVTINAGKRRTHIYSRVAGLQSDKLQRPRRTTSPYTTAARPTIWRYSSVERSVACCIIWR